MSTYTVTISKHYVLSVAAGSVGEARETALDIMAADESQMQCRTEVTVNRDG